MERKPFRRVRQEQNVIGWVLVALGLLGICAVIVENLYWWTPLVSAALVGVFAAPWYWFVVRPVRRDLDAASELPEGAVIESRSEFRRRMAVRMGVAVVIVLVVAEFWDGGGYFSAAGFTAIGASYLLFARSIARRETREHIVFLRELRVGGRTGRSKIFKGISTGDPA